MELDMDLGELEYEDEHEEKVFAVISEETLVPKDQSFLGLDIAEHSTGICIYKDGKRKTYNSVLDYNSKSLFKEVLLRRELKADLSELIGGEEFNVIIIEDAFQGVNPATTRTLYAINTAIDELILDEVVKCKEFVRVQNSTWKKWLYTLDSEGTYKGLKDKVKISKCLEDIGITEEGEGYQDRLDATGMVIGYLLCRSEAREVVEKKKRKRVEMSDVGMCYVASDVELAYAEEEGIEERIYLPSRERYSRKKILDYLTDNPEALFISEEPVMLGRIAVELKLPYIDGGGYFAFWVKSSKLYKYLGGN